MESYFGIIVTIETTATNNIRFCEITSSIAAKLGRMLK